MLYLLFAAINLIDFTVMFNVRIECKKTINWKEIVLKIYEIYYRILSNKYVKKIIKKKLQIFERTKLYMIIHKFMSTKIQI